MLASNDARVSVSAKQLRCELADLRAWSRSPAAACPHTRARAADTAFLDAVAGATRRCLAALEHLLAWIARPDDDDLADLPTPAQLSELAALTWSTRWELRDQLVDLQHDALAPTPSAVMRAVVCRGRLVDVAGELTGMLRAPVVGIDPAQSRARSAERWRAEAEFGRPWGAPDSSH